VKEDDLLTVGQFARLVGVTTHTLRHYDAVQLLIPADVDAETGYRRYSRDQLRTARLIAELRWLDLPIRQVREVVEDPDADAARDILNRHAERLVRERTHLERQIAQCRADVQKGIVMPTINEAVIPAQIKIAVDDRTRARRFYDEAFGLEESVIRHTDDADFPGYQFGEPGRPGFFLLILVDRDAFDAPGRSTFGLGVGDLDATHSRALRAGAEEVVAVHDSQGMPRNSAVTDPDGNWIWLFQN
jgi:DNA-binding transcriptional MerR regulator